MSSSQNPNNTSSRRIKSIRRRLSSRVVGRKISICFWHNFALFFLIMFIWFLAAEYFTTGIINPQARKYYINFDVTKRDVLDKELDRINSEYRNDPVVKSREISKAHYDMLQDAFIYVVSDRESGKVFAELYFFPFMCVAFVFVSGLFVLQLIGHLLSFPSENARVKRILSPLNEIAQRADELSRIDFSEDKYHLIEEKINVIEPDDEQKISLGDEDLLGIENAMNSLVARIRESNRQQARFVNDASHELRTPIAVIQGYANMLARWGREDEKVLDESITAIQNESDNMKRLVEQLLFLARGDAGRTVLNKTEVNLNSLMQEVYEESLMIDENHIYKFRCPETDVRVSADEGLIKQALRILVDNAAKYTNTKDEIILTVGISDKNEPFLQVQDSGIGMKQVDVEHMFERFYRADEARSFNGTGLGLSIAKWIVDKHEGHFEIVSREELGTRIGIYLPNN